MRLPDCFSPFSNIMLVGDISNNYGFINNYLSDHFDSYDTVFGINLAANVKKFNNHQYKNTNKLVSDMTNYLHPRKNERTLIIIDATCMESINTWLTPLLLLSESGAVDLIVASDNPKELNNIVKDGFRSILYQPLDALTDTMAYNYYFLFMNTLKSFQGEISMVYPHDFLVYHNHIYGGDSWFYFSNQEAYPESVTPEKLLIEV